MKSHSALFVAAVFLAAAAPSHAQILNWGGQFGDVITDSNGDLLTDSEGNLLDENFTFELGAFVSGFNPTEHHFSEWVANWRVFDTAAFNGEFGYFNSTVNILNGVTSSNPSADPGSFAGLVAYLWVRNSDQPVAGTEWLLVRSGGVDDAWTFPATGGDCCSTVTIEWSISDLDSNDTPLWGRQNNVNGNGNYTDISSPGSNLQTFTFVPEPSSALLASLAMTAAMLRRRRNA